MLLVFYYEKDYTTVRFVIHRRLNNLNSYNELLRPFIPKGADRSGKNCITVVTEDFNILHLNSTLVYSREHQNELIIGTEKLWIDLFCGFNELFLILPMVFVIRSVQKTEM